MTETNKPKNRCVFVAKRAVKVWVCPLQYSHVWQKMPSDMKLEASVTIDFPFPVMSQFVCWANWLVYWFLSLCVIVNDSWAIIDFHSAFWFHNCKKHYCLAVSQELVEVEYIIPDLYMYYILYTSNTCITISITITFCFYLCINYYTFIDWHEKACKLLLFLFMLS